MPTDLELIQQIEGVTSTKLPKTGAENIMTNTLPCYSVDEGINVTGLNLRGIHLNQSLADSIISLFNNLRKLNLLGTQLTDISFLQGLIHLTELSLTNNNIKDISPLRELKDLKQLYLSGNQITAVSPLVELNKLERLWLKINRIKFLPEEFFELKMKIEWDDKIKTGIHLKGNPIESPPLDVIKAGKEAINTFFESIRKKTTSSIQIKKEAEELVKIFKDIPIPDQKTVNPPDKEEIQTKRKKGRTNEVDIKTDLPTLKSDFFKLKDILEELEIVKNNSKLREELKQIEDSLDELNLKSSKKKLIKPLNKLYRLLETNGDDNAKWSKIIEPVKKGIGLAWKLSTTYNNFARWLELPKIEKPLTSNIDTNAVLSLKINKIALKNFRLFEDKEFSFSPRFNLLLGNNGSGKTAVLDALALILSSIFICFDEVEKSHRLQDIDIRQVSNKYGDEVRMEPIYPVSVEVDGIVMDKNVHWSKSLESKANPIDEDDWDLTAITERFKQHVKQGTPVTLPVIAYYGTGRLWLRKETEKVDPIPPVSRFYAYKDCLDPRSNEKELVRWMKEQELTTIQHKTKSNLYEAVKKAITDCIEEYKEIWFDFRHDSIMVKSRDGNCIPAYYASDGYRNMIAVAADIASRMSILNPHLGIDVTQKTPGIVLIDEIDLHLHPNWQRRVVEDLTRTFPCVQFIATSHSPFIVQSLKNPDELVNLDQPGQLYAKTDTSIEDIAEEIMNVHMPQKSKRYIEMMKTAEEYYKLLEEGKSAKDGVELKRIENKLDELSIPFSDNPALHAFLKMERTAAGLYETHR